MTEILTRPAAAVAAPPVAGFDEALTCTQVIDVTHDVKTFHLAPERLDPIAFQPGQHLTLTVEIDGEPVQRCYTLSSPPTRSGPLAITVKRVPDGPVSGWLHDHLVPGGTVWATGPHGEFTCEDYPSGPYLFLSAGSGITPLMSMTRTLYDRGPTDVVFVHSARTPADIIFRDELALMSTRGDILVTTVCEGDSPDEQWSGPTGRLGLRTLLGVPDLHEREVFTCGPPAYMESVRQLLEMAGVDPERCHEESFDLSAGAPPEEDVDLSGPRYAVQLSRTGRSVECAAGETLLHAVHRAGLNPPSMCAQGMCGTCKTRLLAGQVDMQHAGGIRQRDIEQGDILTCCSTPLGDVELDA